MGMPLRPILSGIRNGVNIRPTTSYQWEKRSLVAADTAVLPRKEKGIRILVWDEPVPFKVLAPAVHVGTLQRPMRHVHGCSVGRLYVGTAIAEPHERLGDQPP